MNSPSRSLSDLAPLRLLSEHGILVGLLLLCAFFSYRTYEEQHPSGSEAGLEVAREIERRFPDGAAILVVTQPAPADQEEFARAITGTLDGESHRVVEVVRGAPVDARRAWERLREAGTQIDAVAMTEGVASWTVFESLEGLDPDRRIRAESYHWPRFLNASNLINIASQIAVIALLAIGMTLVIITGGIDLSVGSLIALSAVVACWFIQEQMGGVEASAPAMVGACLIAIALTALVGFLTGALITTFDCPPFIATLGMMLIASGLAYIIAEGQSIYRVPDSFVWLGRRTDVVEGVWDTVRLGMGPRDLEIPNSVPLMLVLYLAAHVLMTRTALGRYIYAVGGNREAARLAGVPVVGVLIFVYTLSGGLAGLGGVVMASELKTGSPTYGLMYELYVIAAVVVGGTSLSGGEGKISGTLIGALIIAVISNGMNLTDVESYTQKVVLGLVILGAVLIDRIKQKGWIQALVRRGRRRSGGERAA